MAGPRLRRDDELAVKARQSWLIRIDDQPERSAARSETVEAAAVALGLSKARVYVLYNDWKQRGRLGLKRTIRRDAGRYRAIRDDDADAWISYATDRNRLHWALTVRIRKYREMLQKAHQRTLECSDATLMRIVRDYLDEHPELTMTPREVKRTFRRQLRMGETESNRVWQWDQHTADFEVVDEVTGEFYRPIGLWLVDRCSGVMLGGQYFRHYDTDAVEAALLDAVFPSDDGACPYHGTPEIIHGDNGKQFTSQWAKRVLKTLDIHLSTGQPCEPTGHGYIESWHGIVSQFERTAPRYVGRDALEAHKPLPARLAKDGVDVPEWSQRWTLDQANGEFRLWVADQMQQPYKGGASRDARFWATVSPERLRVPDPRALAWEVMDQAFCTVRGGIIQFNTIRYTAEHLAEFNGRRVEVHYLRGDLSRLWVAPFGEFFCIATPLVEHRYHSEGSKRDLRARNREFRGWKRDVEASADVLRAAAELTGVSQAEADQAAEIAERVAARLRPEHREALVAEHERRQPGGEVIDLNARRPLQTKPVKPDRPPLPSVAAEDLAAAEPAKRREKVDQREYI